ncbi:MAG: hypothetical protein FIA97_17045 [Methylococcaceae bacterium]|nr:hypothetical protein [Methylococcaceae bacterium]
MSGTLFGVLLALGLGTLGFFLFQGKASASDQSNGLADTDVATSARSFYREAMALAEQSTAMPVQIFELAGQINSQEDGQSALEVAEQIFRADQGPWGFGRRVAVTTLRFKGVEAFGPDLRERVERLVLAALNDRAVWVRYDAAWVAGMFALNAPAIRDRIQEIKQELGKTEAKHDKADESLSRRVNEYLENVKAREDNGADSGL